MSERRWDVWRAVYGTYADIERDGDVKAHPVAGPMTLEEAFQMSGNLGFGYCVKPIEMRGAR